MTSKAFFDTDVLLYALVLQVGASRDLRADKAEEILCQGGVVSVQVLNEFADVLSRKFKLSWEKIGNLLETVGAICGPALPLTAEAQRAAVDISSRYGYRIYDSFILATAMDSGCTIVYSEDMQHGQIIEGLRIVNPFLTPQTL